MTETSCRCATRIGELSGLHGRDLNSYFLLGRTTDIIRLGILLIDLCIKYVYINEMTVRKLYRDKLYAHFVTFTCYRRRRLLDHSAARTILLDIFRSQLESRKAGCIDYVIMPNHVHAILRFSEVDQLSVFIQQWKRLSSFRIKQFMRGKMTGYFSSVGSDQPFWQPKYYESSLYEERTLREKIDYIHNNPVRAGLVKSTVQWQWSSARYYLSGDGVDVPISPIR